MEGMNTLSTLHAIRPGTVDIDLSDPHVEVPDDLHAVLSDAGRLTAFLALDSTYQRAFIAWIEDATKPSMRATRVNQTIDRVRHPRS